MQKTKKTPHNLFLTFNYTPGTLNLYLSKLESGLIGMKRWQKGPETDEVTNVILKAGAWPL